MITDEPQPQPRTGHTSLNLVFAGIAALSVTVALLQLGAVREANAVIVQLAKPVPVVQAPQQNLQPIVEALNANRRDVLILATNLAQTMNVARELAQRLPPPVSVPPLASTNASKP